MFLLDLVSVFFHLAALCTFQCVVRPLGALLRIFNILVCHTIVSPWFVAIPYSESVCVFVGGAGWGFIPCFSLTLSPSSFSLRLCVRLCAWFDPLAPSFVFLTYLFAIPLFPHGPWPPHTFCAFFFCVMYLAVLGAYGDGMGWEMGIYGCGSCLCACSPCSTFLLHICPSVGARVGPASVGVPVAPTGRAAMGDSVTTDQWRPSSGGRQNGLPNSGVDYAARWRTCPSVGCCSATGCACAPSAPSLMTGMGFWSERSGTWPHEWEARRAAE